MKKIGKFGVTKRIKCGNFLLEKKEDFFSNIYECLQNMRACVASSRPIQFTASPNVGRETHEWGVLWPVLLPSLKVKVIKCSLTVVSQSVHSYSYPFLHTVICMKYDLLLSSSLLSLANFIAFLWLFNDSKRFV